MAPWCDFYEQVTVDTESGSSAPTWSCASERARHRHRRQGARRRLPERPAASTRRTEEGLRGYVAAVRAHMNGLGSKAYWDQFEESPELVVMYLPGETFFSAAIENDPGLIEDGSFRKVISPRPRRSSRCSKPWPTGAAGADGKRRQGDQPSGTGAL